MLRPKIGLDWDDVTAPFNSIAVAMANEKYHIDPPLRLEEIDTWENRGRAGVIKEFYEDEELYARQQVPEKNKSSASSDGNCGCLFHYCGSSGVYGDSCKTDPYGISGISTGKYYSGKCQESGAV